MLEEKRLTAAYKLLCVAVIVQAFLDAKNEKGYFIGQSFEETTTNKESFSRIKNEASDFIFGERLPMWIAAGKLKLNVEYLRKHFNHKRGACLMNKTITYS